MKPTSSLARVLVAAAAILGLASCMSYEPPLRIALIRWPPFEFLHLAQEKGYFAEEGVEVRLIEFVAVNDTQRAFEHDKIDGGTFSLFQVLQNRDQLTRKMQVPLVIDFSDGADLLLARPEIADVRSLRGHRVGVTLSPLDIFFLTRALELHGMSLQDVSLVYVRTADMAEALRDGKVDAITAYPPNSTEVENAGIARPIFSSSHIPGEIVDVLALDEAVIRQRPDDVAGVIRAFYRAVRFAQEHPEEAWQIMSARERVTPEEFRAALQTGITLVPLADQQKFLGKDSSLPAVTARVSQVLKEKGLLSGVHAEHDLLNGAPAALAVEP
ncbi:MAG TPA: ABC transporter substrate-binding protein [Steroidobacteraceae bacterium]|nr:ABC transporter substrate-binding protein [Steroidobacteraceae bacterium]